MGRLDGRVAIVTGGAKGIGRHYSLALAAEGARLMIADIADGAAVADAIARAHGDNSAASAIADVSDEAAVKALVAETMERFGKIDILVNNAAVYATLPEAKCTDIDVAMWDRVMAVNLRGPFLMVKHVTPHMMAQGYGKIINIGSGTAFKGHPEVLALCDVERRHHGLYPGAVPRARRTRHPGQYAGAGLYAQRYGGRRKPQARGNRRQALGRRPRHPPRRTSAGSARRAGLPRRCRQRFHHGQTIAVDGGNVNT
jgi:hypothetical protein